MCCMDGAQNAGTLTRLCTKGLRGKITTKLLASQYLMFEEIPVHTVVVI